MKQQKEVLLGLFAIDPRYQSQGLGGTLFRACLNHVQRKWPYTHRVLLWVLEQRAELLKWYLHLGFTWTGRIEVQEQQRFLVLSKETS